MVRSPEQIPEPPATLADLPNHVSQINNDRARFDDHVGRVIRNDHRLVVDAIRYWRGTRQRPPMT
jgi:hypothetical protein